MKPVPPGRTDDQDAEEADAGREPAPPSDLIAHGTGRGAGSDGQRRELQDGDGVADRHAHEGAEKEEGRADLGDGSADDLGRDSVRQGAGRAMAEEEAQKRGW